MPEKIYLETLVKYYADGKIAPVSFVFEDREIKIDRVLGISLTFPDKIGGAHYTCQADGKKINLFFDLNRWYIEKE